jgi:hypothetical protein
VTTRGKDDGIPRGQRLGPPWIGVKRELKTWRRKEVGLPEVGAPDWLRIWPVLRAGKGSEQDRTQQNHAG